ncbi:ImmA/IrrE family metallo-endopeptidase [Acidimicrobiaceae bacterium AH-315-P05]|nr:ImmA/IrrE family metallo-endopeptidase [Acidimicrobiaceae bacterium AH-315-P05]
MTVRVEVQPVLLQWARTRSGIEDETWEKRFPRYDAWLVGEAIPTLKQLEDFARKTYTPVGFFFLEEPPVEEVPIPDFRTIRDQPIAGVAGQVSADLLDTVYVCQARQEWYRDNQLLNGEAPLDFVGSAALVTPLIDAVDRMRVVLDWTVETRRRLKSWDAALTRLRENAEAAGVLVMISGIVGSNTHRKLDPDEFRGFALADPYAAVVFVNGADSKAAQIFTLAHELAHLWLGETALSDVAPESNRSYAQERWCNQVAAELLVPMEEFRLVFDPAADLRIQLQPLAEQFRVSTQVILGRVREAGALTWDQFMAELRAERERVAELVAERGGGENYYNTKPVQVGKRFARELIASTLEGRTPYTEAFRLLDVKKTTTFEGLGAQLGVL